MQPDMDAVMGGQRLYQPESRPRLVSVGRLMPGTVDIVKD